MTRHEARQCALQALYQIDVSNGEIHDALVYVLEERQVNEADLAYVRKLVEGTRSHLIELDEQLTSVMERWSTERIGRVELNVLRLALYELLHDESLSTATIVDEAVRLAKSFATDTSGKFVNGVLAKLLPVARPNDTDKTQTDRKTQG